MLKPALAHDSVCIPIIAKYIARNKGDLLNATYDAERDGAPSKVVNYLKTAIGAGSVSDPTTAGGIADTGLIGAAFMQSLESTSAFFQILANGMLKTPLRVRVNLSAEPATGYLVNEGLSKPMTRLTMNSQVVPLSKCVAMLAVTNEVLASSSNAAQTFISTELCKAVARAVDAAFLAAIVDGNTPIINSDGVTALFAGSDLKDLFSVVPHHDGARYFLVAAPDVAIAAATLQDTEGVFVFGNMSPSGGEMLGVPVLVSSAADAGTLTLIDASGVAGNAETVTIESSGHADLEMQDVTAGSMLTPTGAAMVSLWQTDSTAIRAAIWFGVLRVRPDAVAVLQSIQWGPVVGT